MLVVLLVAYVNRRAVGLSQETCQQYNQLLGFQQNVQNMNEYLESFKSYISELSPISEVEWNRSVSLCNIKKYNEKEIIHSQGEVSDSIMFLCDGLARSYLIDTEGRDFTWSVHFNAPESNIKNLFVVDYASFIKSEPSKLGFEALQNTTVVKINKEDVYSLYSSSHYWSNIGRVISEMAYYFTHHRTLSLLTQSAKERYENLVSENISFIENVPQYYVASYLGITPQSLSRLKKEVRITKCE
ncbi:MAG: Crp/Fnr family transcriptional regulator [Sedimenticola sp.]